MPRAPKACAHPECETRVVAVTYCPEHKPHGWQSGGRSRTDTAQARRWRRQVLDRAGWRCEIRGPRCAGRAVQADHVVAVEFGGAEYDVANGQAVCGPCHLPKTLREARAGREKRAARRRPAPKPVGQVRTDLP